MPRCLRQRLQRARREAPGEQSGRFYPHPRSALTSEREQSEEALSALSHELRTPLAAITGFAELLHARDDERTRIEASAQIMKAAERLSGAIDRLLTAIEEAGGNLAVTLAELPKEPT
jgi:signal transduction histidine kinase